MDSWHRPQAIGLCVAKFELHKIMKQELFTMVLSVSNARFLFSNTFMDFLSFCIVETSKRGKISNSIQFFHNYSYKLQTSKYHAIRLSTIEGNTV